MNIFKKILLGLACLIAVILIVALFVKKDYAVVRDVTINKPKQQVFEYVKYLKNMDNYGKWNKMDPDAKKTYTGTDGTVGFIAAWDSQVKDVGKGEQEIKNIAEGDRIDMELRFEKPMKGSASAYMTTENASNDQTKVKWGFYGKMPYPMNVMLLCADMDKMLGPELQTGLNNLKTVLEK